MERKKWNKDDLIAYAAGWYLSTTLPPDWTALSKQQLMLLVSQNTWQPFEQYSPEEVWEFILEMAVDLNLTFVLGANIHENH